MKAAAPVGPEESCWGGSCRSVASTSFLSWACKPPAFAQLKTINTKAGADSRSANNVTCVVSRCPTPPATFQVIHGNTNSRDASKSQHESVPDHRETCGTSRIVAEVRHTMCMVSLTQRLAKSDLRMWRWYFWLFYLPFLRSHPQRFAIKNVINSPWWPIALR
jgi:hypothetical protein